MRVGDLNNNEMGWCVHTPGQCRRCYQYLDLLFDKEPLNNRPVLIVQSSMMHTDTKL